MSLDRHLEALKYGFLLKKPVFLARVAGHYARMALSRRSPLRYVDFAVDYKCNLKCSHCFKSSLENNSTHPQLSIAGYREIARECLSLGVLHFSFQGGEITVYDKLEELLGAMYPGRVLMSLTTNGSFLDGRRIRNYRKWGVDLLNISLDSMDPLEHDTFRNMPGCHALALEGLRLARRSGMRVAVNTTVSRFNLYTRGFEGLVDFCMRERIILNLLLAVPAGSWAANMDALVTTEDMKYVRALVLSSPLIRQDSDSINIGYGCPALKEAVYITPFGDVLPCPFIHVSLGNLHEERLATIRERGLGYHFFERHARACLAAEDRSFISKYLSRTFGRNDLPMGFKEIFGEPSMALKEYILPAPSVAPGLDVRAALSEWHEKIRKGAAGLS
ncbi:MAG: hypothetical protein A2583_06005 [Bdellovibrionales bacterium RIFOXYD1_FULL_53_11]|nr:MAG: hypothetical protein A2583_06005 [Bdellovibrionales bacterium RIFOXYD1_FULL_53_11]